jgi:hypothetical protein
MEKIMEKIMQEIIRERLRCGISGYLDSHTEQ